MQDIQAKTQISIVKMQQLSPIDAVPVRASTPE
jgi:hypothetical protein